MTMDFTVSYTVTRQRVAELLCSALEGGSNYWIEDVTPRKPSSWEFYSYPEDHRVYQHDYPFNPGGALSITVDTEIESEPAQVHVLDENAIQKGLTLFLETSPHRFAQLITEHADADDADVFLQLCLFGEILYG